MVRIYIPADDVWSFFHSNIDRLKKEMVVIAENKDTEYAVYLTEDKGYPSFAVCKGLEEPEYEEGAVNENDCTETAKRCFVRYLFPVVVDNQKGFPNDTWGEDEPDEWESPTKQDMQDKAYEREDELRLALCDFLAVVLNLDGDPVDAVERECGDILDEIMDYFLEYLGFKQRLEIYRPMFLTDDETRSEIYTEYPYDITAETHIASPFEELDDDGTYDYGSDE